jgi:hypothetical protein
LENLEKKNWENEDPLENENLIDHRRRGRVYRKQWEPKKKSNHAKEIWSRRAPEKKRSLKKMKTWRGR